MKTQKADIVIVDDNTDNLRILAGILKNRGYQARPVSSGAMALDAVFDKPPAMILLDIMMPEMDGYEVCRQLKAVPDTWDIPIIFITALDELEEKLKAFAAGGMDYITKPFQEAEVLARIETHLALVQAKESLRKKEVQHQQALKAKSLMRMAGAIAHKFNNYLQAMMGNLEMGISDVAKNGPVPQTLYAAMESAESAAELSRLMLTYTGKTPVRYETVDLSDYCRTNLALFQAILSEQTILTTDLETPGPVIKANTAQIHQMLTHLITNAQEAMDGVKGVISLSVKIGHPSDFTSTHYYPLQWAPMDADYACLTISDGGRGIAASNIEDIFDPFYSTNFTGRGLGLPVALGIATAHNGGITVESEEGKGSIFRVFFPIIDS